MKSWLKNNQSLLLIVLAAFLGGGVTTFMKISAREIPPISFTLSRFLFAGVVLLPIFLKKENISKIKNIKTLILISLFGTGNVVMLAFGVKLTTASIAQTLYAVVPILVGIFSYLILREKLTNKKVMGILIGFLGVLLIIFLPIIDRGSPFNGNVVGNFLVLTAVLSFSMYTVLSKKFQKEYSPLALTSIFILVTILTQTIIAPVEIKTNPLWWQHLSIMAFIGVLYVGVIGTALYYLLYQYAIKSATPVIASMILYLQPVFSFLWAFVLLGERLNGGLVLGASLAFIGVAFVTYTPKRLSTSTSQGKISV